MHLDISIIIPCYNTRPEYLQEAVKSVYAYKGKRSYEIIITDDGSTSLATLDLLKTFEQKGIMVLYQENKGPAAARNTAAKKANGTYLLFLDSDNKLYADYIDDGINALQTNAGAAVAYGNPNFIGDVHPGRNLLPATFDINRMLVENYIDMCAVVRKTAWENVGGLDEERILIGHEDWEFWLSLYSSGWEFIHIDKTLFDYRIAEGSLITKTTEDIFFKKLEYVFKKHWKLVYQTYYHLYGLSITYKNDIKRPVRSFIKYTKNKFSG